MELLNSFELLGNVTTGNVNATNDDLEEMRTNNRKVLAAIAESVFGFKRGNKKERWINK